ncbi:MAG: virulence-associated E family protein [Hyphomicrobium sp.]|jgi:predicted P-loop ATPase
MNAASTIKWPESVRDKDGKKTPVHRSQHNIRTFLDACGIELRRNAFSLRDEITRDGHTRTLDDAELRRLRLEADARGLRPKTEFFNDVIFDLARQNAYHPVLAYIEGLTWDGRKRLDQVASYYAGAENTGLNRAMMRATLIAAVRRIRHPGSKFDNLLVLEGKQGAGKSSFVKALAGEPWFSDSLHIGTDPKETIEQTSGKWICELAELAGLGKKDRERVKAFLSRSVDSARLSYQRIASDVPRQFVLVATTNTSEYLSDTTGNRRFWPMRVGIVNLAAVRRDRDQIWAEAAHYEAKGESTQLARELWSDAEGAQNGRMITDPWLDQLEPALAGTLGAVATADLWKFLEIKAAHQDPYSSQRLTAVMAQLGFEKKKKRKDGAPLSCYVSKGAGASHSAWINLATRGMERSEHMERTWNGATA